MKKLLIIAFALLPFALHSAQIAEMVNTEADEQLLEASQAGNLEQVWKALNDGANVNCVNKKDHLEYSPLHYAAIGGDIKIINLLILAKATIDVRDRYNYTPLHYAVKESKIEVVKKLVLLKANIEARNNDHGTPLNIAVQNGFVHTVNFLILAKAAINDQSEMTSLHWAARNGHSKIADLLIKLNADIEARDETGWTPLYWAAHFARNEVVKVLILGRADINAINNSLNTPLYPAVIGGHIKTVETLLNMGANPLQFNRYYELLTSKQLEAPWLFVRKNGLTIAKMIKDHCEHQETMFRELTKFFTDQQNQLKIPAPIANLITQYAFGTSEIDPNNKDKE